MINVGIDLTNDMIKMEKKDEKKHSGSSQNQSIEFTNNQNPIRNSLKIKIIIKSFLNQNPNKPCRTKHNKILIYPEN